MKMGTHYSSLDALTDEMSATLELPFLDWYSKPGAFHITNYHGDNTFCLDLSNQFSCFFLSQQNISPRARFILQARLMPPV